MYDVSPRIEFDHVLRELWGQVYYNPPAGYRMVYPAIVYSLDSADTTFADNIPYRVERRYQVQVITKDPDSHLVDLVARLPTAVLQSTFVQDSLYHFSFRVYA